ncbi:MAG: cytochrome c [Desulfosarcinaceae bacterium]
MKTPRTMLLCLALIACVVTAAFAQFAKPEDAIAYRKSVMTLIGHHFGLMAAVVKGQKPYVPDAFKRNAMLVETFSKLPWEAFMVPGTDKGDTRLLPKAFKEPSKFHEDAQKFEAEAAKLATVSQSGDFEAVRSQFGEVGKACQQCHKAFRSR